MKIQSKTLEEGLQHLWCTDAVTSYCFPRYQEVRLLIWSSSQSLRKKGKAVTQDHDKITGHEAAHGSHLIVGELL